MKMKFKLLLLLLILISLAGCLRPVYTTQNQCDLACQEKSFKGGGCYLANIYGFSKMSEEVIGKCKLDYQETTLACGQSCSCKCYK